MSQATELIRSFHQRSDGSVPPDIDWLIARAERCELLEEAIRGESGDEPDEAEPRGVDFEQATDLLHRIAACAHQLAEQVEDLADLLP